MIEKKFTPLPADFEGSTLGHKNRQVSFAGPEQLRQAQAVPVPQPQPGRPAPKLPAAVPAAKQAAQQPAAATSTPHLPACGFDAVHWENRFDEVASELTKLRAAMAEMLANLDDVKVRLPAETLLAAGAAEVKRPSEEGALWLEMNGLQLEATAKGTPVIKVFCGEYQKFGVPLYPEIFSLVEEIAGADLLLKQRYLCKGLALVSKAQGTPKVIGISGFEWVTPEDEIPY